LRSSLTGFARLRLIMSAMRTGMPCLNLNIQIRKEREVRSLIYMACRCFCRINDQV
jgi:hypothetical protein